VAGVAERLSLTGGVSARGVEFAVSAAWFDAWDAAYGIGRARAIGGVRLHDTRARLGLLSYRLRRSRTNPHTAIFDGEPDGAAPATLLDGADVVRLDYLPEDSALLAAARSWPGARIAPHAVAPVVDCRSRYADWLKRRSKRIRQRWPKQERHVFETLGLRYERVAAADDLPMLLAELFALERAGWKGRERTAIADSAADTRFYTALATRAMAAGALRLALLRNGERLVAFEYAILGGDTAYVLKVGYDEAYEDASVGHVLAARHIRDCCDDPAIAWYDQLGNGMTPAPYKLRFADALHTRWRVTLYGGGVGQLVRARDMLRDRIKAWRR
jgi:hypothetical protein